MSRRAAEEAVADGRVTVNGLVASVGARIDVGADTVSLDGIPLPVRPALRYYLINKPAGVISTASDPQSRPVVVDLVPDGTRVVPVGRLDADSEGLLILTNDGDLTNLLTHPRFGVTKTYAVLVEGVVTPRQLRHLHDGVELEDGPAHVVSARVLGETAEQTHLEVVMAEGRKREVRRMLAAVGHPVVRLFRTAIGPLVDSDLRAGEFRELTMAEVRALYEAAS